MNKQHWQNVTMKDIAKETGYSVNTVSRALRDKDDISDATKEVIQSKAEEMGYINNQLASSLRLGHTNMIAVILGDISNPHFGIMMKEIEGRARYYGYTSFLINTNENDKMEKDAILMALNKNVDGIIICPAQHNNDNIEFLMDMNIPFVQIGRHSQDLESSYVVCNDELGGYQATNYLLENGHENILMLGGPSYISSAKERLAGYKRAHKEKGIPLNENLIREIPIMSNACSTEIDELLKYNLDFTAIFAFSDMIAWEAWTRLSQHGYSIPDDCSIVGFDNIQSRLAIPHRLTSISSYKAMMSTTAVDCLVSKMQKGKAKRTPQPPVKCDADCSHIIDTRLVKGNTVLRRV